MNWYWTEIDNGQLLNLTLVKYGTYSYSRHKLLTISIHISINERSTKILFDKKKFDIQS